MRRRIGLRRRKPAGRERRADMLPDAVAATARICGWPPAQNNFSF
jgi:hypothetical protein